MCVCIASPALLLHLDEFYTSSLYYFISPLKMRQQQKQLANESEANGQEDGEDEDEVPERPPPPSTGGHNLDSFELIRPTITHNGI